MALKFETKFTKGDIVVNPEKLAFLQKKHIQKALSNPSPKNDNLIDEFVSGPLLQRAREMEYEKKRLVTDGVKQNSLKLHPLFSLGDSILPLAPLTGDQNCGDAYQRIRSALRIVRSEATDPTTVVNANRYLIWRPSIGRLSETFSLIVSESTKIVICGEPASATEVSEYLASQFGKIVDSLWSVDNLRSALDEAAKHISYSEADRLPASLVYNFLRWALLGLDDGPQMSHLMVYLGRAETLKRLQMANTVARSQFPRPSHDPTI